MEIKFQRLNHRGETGVQTKCGSYDAVRVAGGYAVRNRQGHTIVVVKTLKEAKETILDFGY